MYMFLSIIDLELENIKWVSISLSSIKYHHVAGQVDIISFSEDINSRNSTLPLKNQIINVNIKYNYYKAHTCI